MRLKPDDVIRDDRAPIHGAPPSSEECVPDARSPDSGWPVVLDEYLAQYQPEAFIFEYGAQPGMFCMTWRWPRASARVVQMLRWTSAVRDHQRRGPTPSAKMGLRH